jgi:calcineurin-like phosphoesterase family protein
MTSTRKPIFFTSDLHIGHANVIKFSNRPFKDLDDMHNKLVKNYNAIVPEHGVCYFLGDIGLCKSEIIREVIGRMNGTKILILGNHDKGVNAMYNMGFDVVLYGATLQIANQRVTLSHCPLLGVFRERTDLMEHGNPGECWHGELNPKRRRFSTHDNGQLHLHGHIHSPNGGKSAKIEGRQFDVGVDANDYRPVSISAIESWISRMSLPKLTGGQEPKARDITTDVLKEAMQNVIKGKNYGN